MTTDDFRSVALALTVVLVIWSSIRIGRDWPQWGIRRKVVSAHLLAYLLVIGYGLTEVRFGIWSTDIRVFVLITVHASLLSWLFVTRHYTD